jgi:hypothetical protein
MQEMLIGEALQTRQAETEDPDGAGMSGINGVQPAGMSARLTTAYRPDRSEGDHMQ